MRIPDLINNRTTIAMKNLEINKGWTKMRCINKETLDYVDITIPRATGSGLRIAILKHAAEYCWSPLDDSSVCYADIKFDFYVMIGKGGVGCGCVKCPPFGFTFKIDLSTNRLTEDSKAAIEKKFNISEGEFFGYLKPKNLI